VGREHVVRIDARAGRGAERLDGREIERLEARGGREEGSAEGVQTAGVGPRGVGHRDPRELGAQVGERVALGAAPQGVQEQRLEVVAGQIVGEQGVEGPARVRGGGAAGDEGGEAGGGVVGRAKRRGHGVVAAEALGRHPLPRRGSPSGATVKGGARLAPGSPARLSPRLRSWAHTRRGERI
jgi:hypothetical protein